MKELKVEESNWDNGNEGKRSNVKETEDKNVKEKVRDGKDIEEKGQEGY